MKFRIVKDEDNRQWVMYVGEGKDSSYHVFKGNRTDAYRHFKEMLKHNYGQDTDLTENKKTIVKWVTDKDTGEEKKIYIPAIDSQIKPVEKPFKPKTMLIKRAKTPDGLWRPE